MKTTLFCALALIVVCCRKPKTDLGPEYTHLIGEWKAISEDPWFSNAMRVEFKKNGRVIVENGPERGVNNRISKYHGMTEDVINNQTFLKVYYEYDRMDGSLHMLNVRKKPGPVDTIQFYPGAIVEADTLKTRYITFYRIN